MADKDVLTFIDNYKSNSCLELIISFGKYSNKFGFDSKCLHKGCFLRIKDLLESCETWNHIVEEEDLKFYDETTKIIDSKILVSNGPYDILASIAHKDRERLYHSEDFIQNTCIYERKHHIYKLSEVKDKFKTYYTFTLILKFNKRVSSQYLYDSTFLKIVDVINCIEKIDTLNFTEN
jgi:hypothetical protein